MKTFLDFQAEINSGKIRNVYFIASSDSYFVSKAGELMREKLFGSASNRDNFFLRYGDESTIDEIMDLSNNTTSLFSSQKIIVLKRAEKYFRKIKELFDFLKKTDHDTYIMVVFDKDYVIEKKYDKDNVFYDFSDLPQDSLSSFIRNEFESRGFNISTGDLEFFISSVPQSIDLLLTEVEKLSNYEFESSDKTITRELILRFIGYDKEFSPGELMAAVLSRDKRRSIEVLEGLSSSAGFSEIYLLSIMSNYYMDLISFKTKGFEYKNSGALYSKYKMWGERAKFAQKYHKSLNLNSLEKSFNKILDTDLKLKTSMLNSKILMTSLVEELVNA
jgi:DNA polymerase III delta subunit